MAYDGRLFTRAVSVLIPLAITDQSTFSNNSRGTLIELFSLHYGSGATSSASPAERLPILKEMMYSQDSRIREVARDACTGALSIHGGFRMVGPEYRGLRRTAEPWWPKDREEIVDAFRNIWNLLDEARLSDMPEPDKKQCEKILTDKARSVALVHVSLVDIVTSSLENISKKGFESKKNVHIALNDMLRYDRKHHVTVSVERIESLLAELEGTSYPDTLRRYVGMPQWEEVHGANEEVKSIAVTKISELAMGAINNPEYLEDSIDWLLSKEAELAYNFGNALAAQDEEYKLYEYLLKSLLDRIHVEGITTLLLSGYLRGMFDRSKQRWETEAIRHLDSDYLELCGLDIVWRSGLSETIVLRILSLAKEGRLVDTKHLAVLENQFSPEVISDSTIHEIVYFFMQSEIPWNRASALVVLASNFCTQN